MQRCTTVALHAQYVHEVGQRREGFRHRAAEVVVVEDQISAHNAQQQSAALDNKYPETATVMLLHSGTEQQLELRPTLTSVLSGT